MYKKPYTPEQISELESLGAVIAAIPAADRAHVTNEAAAYVKGYAAALMASETNQQLTESPSV